ncbi:hypothetical protein HKCCE2091_15405 [Rhodobacterales bacterium HKCCE2091]|nr:hypothetical protein [Rhodobacterales bacterium HKCCE2091]
MPSASDILSPAIARKLSRCDRDIWFHAVIGLLSVVAGAGLFVFLWRTFGESGGEFVAQMVKWSSSLVVFGIGGVFGTKLLALRDEVNLGREWQKLYESALGPPPNAMLADVRKGVFDWLGGS